MSNEQIIWTLEQDYCDNCGAYLFEDGINDDNSGLCSTCFDLWIEEQNADEIDDGYDAEADMQREHEIALREGGYYICFPDKEQRP